MINAKRIEEMKRLSSEATEGVNGKWDTDELFVFEGDGMILGELVAKVKTEIDAQFIAESRQFVPDIIAAYEEKVRAVEAHTITIVGLSGMVERRDAEIARLRKALEFYADDNVYVYDVLSVDDDGTENCDEPPVIYDNGKIAREALK